MKVWRNQVKIREMFLFLNFFQKVEESVKKREIGEKYKNNQHVPSLFTSDVLSPIDSSVYMIMYNML